MEILELGVKDSTLFIGQNKLILSDFDQIGENVYQANSLQLNMSGEEGFSTIFFICVLILIFLLAGVAYCYVKKSKQILIVEKQAHAEEDRLKKKIEKINEEKAKISRHSLSTTIIFKKIHQQIDLHMDDYSTKELLKEEEWVELAHEINMVSDDFTHRLKSAFPELSNLDIRYCCLFKIGLNPKEISCLVGRTPNMVYKRRRAISRIIQLSEEQSGLEYFLATY